MAGDFFEGTWTTCAEPDELLVAARFPVWDGPCGFAIEEVARRHGDFAIAGAVADVRVDDQNRVKQLAVAMFGVAATPVRAPDAEAALHNRAIDAITPADIAEIAALAAAATDPADDIHATAAQRRRIVQHVVGNVVRRAVEEANANA